MKLERKLHIIRLFNDGYFNLSDADFYHRQGVNIICQNGKVVDIITDTI